jgi:hypothetical protein
MEKEAIMGANGFQSRIGMAILVELSKYSFYFLAE